MKTGICYMESYNQRATYANTFFKLLTTIIPKSISCVYL